MTEDTLPSKSGNPQSLKKQSEQLESSLTNVHIVAEDLLRAFEKLFFFYGFVFQVISKKTLCSKDFTRNSRDILYENIRNYNSYKFSAKICFYTLFVLSQKLKTRTKFSASWWSGSEKYFCFLCIASRTLLQRYPKFNRLIKVFSYMLLLLVL